MNVFACVVGNHAVIKIRMSISSNQIRHVIDDVIVNQLLLDSRDKRGCYHSIVHLRNFFNRDSSTVSRLNHVAFPVDHVFLVACSTRRNAGSKCDLEGSTPTRHPRFRVHFGLASVSESNKIFHAAT